MPKSTTIRVYVIPVGDKPWQLRWKDPVTRKWKQESTGTHNLEKANKAAIIKQHELEEGRAKEVGGKLPWAAFQTRYDEEYLSGLAAGSRVNAIRVLNSVASLIGPATVGGLTSALVSTWQSKLRKKGNAEATIASKSATLLAALQWAVERGYLSDAPKFPPITRVTGKKRMRGRAPTDAEFATILSKVADVVGPEREAKWKRSINGLWLSGLRISEAIDLSWNEPGRMQVDLSGRYPMLKILAEQEKGFQDRMLPIVPDFAEWLLETPADRRAGAVFEWPRLRKRQGKDPDRVDEFWVIHRIGEIGKKAGVIVNDHPKVKYASAHDFRRAFGERWARKEAPAVLMELMRHADIQTTMQYYVTLEAEQTAASLWAKSGKAYDHSCDPTGVNPRVV